MNENIHTLVKHDVFTSYTSFTSFMRWILPGVGPVCVAAITYHRLVTGGADDQQARAAPHPSPAPAASRPPESLYLG